MAYFKTWEGIVEREWLDELDHVNFLTYQRIADEASTAVWKDAKGEDDSSVGLEFVMTETYVRYIRELRLGDEVEIRTEPPRLCRRPFGLSYAAMAGTSSMA